VTASDRTSPYQGLTPFDEQDSAYFFGREKDASLIVADLFAAPITLLYGASGVGKSSVLRAGVLPLLRKRDDVLPVVFATWQSDATASLKGAVAQALYACENTTGKRYQDELLRFEYDPLPGFLRKCAKLAGRQLMIILDQFEEYSLYHPHEDDPFAEQFPAATLLGDLSVSFLVSLREEAVARLDRFEGSIPTLFDNFRRIEHLDPASARQAILRPLEKYNASRPDEPPMKIDPDFVDQVLDQVHTGRVQIGDHGRGTEVTGLPASAARIEAPYLQLVMTRLWNEERDAGSPMIHARTLHRLGGAERIVQTHLDAVMARFEPKHREIAASIFQLLVTPSGTKIAHGVTDLAIHAGVDALELQTLLTKLEGGADRVLRTVAPLPERPGENRYEIFHDRLAQAVLDWRSRYLTDKQVVEAKRGEAQTHHASGEHLPSKPPRKPPRETTAAEREPPWELFARSCEKQRLSLIVGAGLSASDRAHGEIWKPGSRFPPTAWELTRVLMEETKFQEDGRGLPTFSEMASYYASKFHRDVLRERIQDFLTRDYDPTHAHRAVAQALRNSSSVIVSTAFDSLMERAFEELDVPYDLVSSTTASGTTLMLCRRAGEKNARLCTPPEVELSDDTPCIYKVFGSIESPEGGGPVLTEEDELKLFSQVSIGELPPSSIGARLSRCHLLFLGMSLRSWTQRMLVALLRRRETKRTSAWVISRYVSEIDNARWHGANVEVFDRELSDFAEHFSAAANSGATARRPSS
jgi:hypothetical protein